MAGGFGETIFKVPSNQNTSVSLVLDLAPPKLWLLQGHTINKAGEIQVGCCDGFQAAEPKTPRSGIDQLDQLISMSEDLQGLDADTITL